MFLYVFLCEVDRVREWFCAPVRKAECVALKNAGFICSVLVHLNPLPFSIVIRTGMQRVCVCVCTRAHEHVRVFVCVRACISRQPDPELIWRVAATTIQKCSLWGIMHGIKTGLGAHQFYRLKQNSDFSVHVCVCARVCVRESVLLVEKFRGPVIMAVLNQMS